MGRPFVHYTCRHCSCHLTVTTQHAWAVLDVVTTGHLHTRKLSWLPSSGASQQNPLGVLVNMWLLGFTPDSCLKTSMWRDWGFVGLDLPAVNLCVHLNCLILSFLLLLVPNTGGSGELHTSR